MKLRKVCSSCLWMWHILLGCRLYFGHAPEQCDLAESCETPRNFYTTVVDTITPYLSFSFSLTPEILSRYFPLFIATGRRHYWVFIIHILCIGVRGIWIISNSDVSWNLNTFYPRIALSDLHVIMLSGLVTLVCEYCTFLANLHMRFSVGFAYN